MTDTTSKQVKNVATNVGIGLLSIPIYSVVAKNNRKMLEESVTFGFVNGLTQQFMPKISDDPNIQKLFLNPVIAGFIQAILKDFVFHGQSERALGRSIIAAISTASIINLIQ